MSFQAFRRLIKASSADLASWLVALDANRDDPLEALQVAVAFSSPGATAQTILNLVNRLAEIEAGTETAKQEAWVMGILQGSDVELDTVGE
jgi:hypothetical protein